MSTGGKIIIALMLAVVGCGGGQPTVEEYARAVCESELRGLSKETKPHSTWGQFRDDAQRAVDALEALPTSPPELQQFHAATLAMWRDVVRMIERYPQEALIRDRELILLMDELAELSEPVDRTIQNMSNDAFAAVTSGC